MITSPSNPIVRELQALHTPRGRKQQRRFLAEGVRLVADALDAGWLPHVCLYDRDALRKTEMGRALLRRLTDPRLGDELRGGIVEGGERAIAAASGTQHPQGVVASFPIREAEIPAGTKAPLALVCDDIQDPGNLGTILRSAEAAGVTAVLLTPGCVDLYSPKVVRAAMGAHFRLPAFPELSWEVIAQTLARLGVSQQRLFATDAPAATPYDAVDWALASALVVSNEAHGLSSSARGLALGGLLTIPMVGGTESLNAAMAAAVILFEAARQRRAPHRHTDKGGT